MIEWSHAVIGRHVELINGFAFPSDGFTQGEGIPLIRIRDLNRCDTEVNFRGRYPERYLVKKGDLLIGMDGDFLTIRWKGDDALLNQRVCKLLTKDGGRLVQDFLFYRVSEAITGINRITAATTVKHLSSKDILGITIELPPKPEQDKIAHILSTIDQAIEQTDALIAKQQRIRNGLMQDLLTRGIDENGDLRSEDTHEFKDSLLGRIPVEWGIRNIDSISDFVTSGARGWTKYYSEEGALFIRIGNLTRHHINLNWDNTVFVRPPVHVEGSRTLVRPNDILISITADLGIIGVIPEGFGEGYVNQHIALVRLTDPKIDSRFAGWFLQSRAGQSQFERLNESGAKAGLNLPTIRSLLLTDPPLDEQKRIAKTLDANITVMLHLQAVLKKQSNLKVALMQDLLTGKIRVTPLLAAAEVGS